MSTITVSRAKDRARGEVYASTRTIKTAQAVLVEATNDQSEGDKYDIFLSHSVSDANIVLGTKLILEDHGYSVYIDWIDDPQLDRSKVSAKTASHLRDRMCSCRSLFYATTNNSTHSKWMPWECGYFDGIKSRVAILPITQTGTEDYSGQEYLGLYPYISEGINTAQQKKLWVNRSPSVYTTFDAWLIGEELKPHT